MHFATDSTGNCTLIRLSYRSGTASVLRRGTTQIATRGTLLPNSHRNQRGHWQLPEMNSLTNGEQMETRCRRVCSIGMWLFLKSCSDSELTPLNPWYTARYTIAMSKTVLK
jgi:hypothetical protein